MPRSHRNLRATAWASKSSVQTIQPPVLGSNKPRMQPMALHRPNAAKAIKQIKLAISIPPHNLMQKDGILLLLLYFTTYAAKKKALFAFFPGDEPKFKNS